MAVNASAGDQREIGELGGGRAQPDCRKHCKRNCGGGRRSLTMCSHAEGMRSLTRPTHSAAAAMSASRIRTPGLTESVSTLIATAAPTIPAPAWLYRRDKSNRKST